MSFLAKLLSVIAQVLPLIPKPKPSQPKFQYSRTSTGRWIASAKGLTAVGDSRPEAAQSLLRKLVERDGEV